LIEICDNEYVCVCVCVYIYIYYWFYVFMYVYINFLNRSTDKQIFIKFDVYKAISSV